MSRKPRTKASPTYSAGPDGARISGALLNWFAVHQRDLPWRRSRDPYRIWVSEVMLQQTRVETVIPYYRRWFDRFPTLRSLAQAPEEEVLKAWEGLGYYSRARNLHGAVREVVAQYGDQLPDDPDSVARLRGVGSYTAGAILSIAFNRPLPAVDGNVMRVLSRLCLIQDNISLPATRQAMETLAADLIPPGQAANFNQALMELGALICSPTRPKCLVCPVAEYCRARLEGVVQQLPLKAKAKAPRAVSVVCAVIWEDGRFLLAQRPPEGLLGGLWEFPGGQLPDGLSPERGLHLILKERYGLQLELEAGLTEVRHVFTHLVWNLKAYTARLDREGAPPARPDLRWVDSEGLARVALPVAHQKVLDAALRSLGNRSALAGGQIGG